MLVSWVHFVLAQAMCVSCALFLHKEKKYGMYRPSEAQWCLYILWFSR